MTMKVEEYLAHIREYRSKQRPPPTEFNGVPQDIVSLIIATGTTGDHRTIAALLPGLSEAGIGFIEKVLLPMHDGFSDETKLAMMTRTELGSPERTFRDAMCNIAFVYLNPQESQVARTPFLEVGGGREVGTSSQYHSIIDPPKQPPQNPLIRTGTRGS
jgi:hypothetical protein